MAPRWGEQRRKEGYGEEDRKGGDGEWNEEVEEHESSNAEDEENQPPLSLSSSLGVQTVELGVESVRFVLGKKVVDLSPADHAIVDVSPKDHATAAGW